MAKKVPNQATAAQRFWDVFKVAWRKTGYDLTVRLFMSNGRRLLLILSLENNCGIVRKKISSCFCQIN